VHILEMYILYLLINVIGIYTVYTYIYISIYV
jgi:hypothetical protein